jgi:MFS family permease
LDRFGGLGVGAISFSLPIIVLLTLTLAPSNLAVATFAAILFGVTLGSEIDVLSYLASRYFKMNNLGILYGVMVSLQGFAMGASPVAAGLIYDAAGSYPPILFGLIPVFAFAAILTATLGPPRQAAATLQR